MADDDFYQRLGVPRGASGEESKRAYRKLASRYHPDRNKARGAEERYKAMQAAYEVLKDKEKRAAYDRFGDQWEAALNAKRQGGYADYEEMTGGFGSRPGGGGFGDGRVNPEDLGDLFGDLFGGGFHAGGRRPPPNRDEEAAMHLRLEDAYAGGVRTLSINGQDLKVRIPAGIGEGKRIRLKGKARSGGDLYLKVRLQPHPRFRVEDRHIHVDLPLSPWEAFLGAMVPAPTLGGEVDMKIPAGSQTGRALRMRGRGLPGDPAGDQFVHLKIVNPPLGDAEVEAAFERLGETADFDPRRS